MAKIKNTVDNPSDLSDLTLQSPKKGEPHFLVIISIIAIVSLVALVALAISLTQRQVVGKAYAVVEADPATPSTDPGVTKLDKNWCYHSYLEGTSSADPYGYYALCEGKCTRPMKGYTCYVVSDNRMA